MACTISQTTMADGDQSYLRFGFKGETQVTDQLTGYGQWEYRSAEHRRIAGYRYTRVGFAGLKFGDAGSFDYGRNYGVLYDIGAGLTCCRSLVVTPTARTTSCSSAATAATYRNSNFFGLVDGWNFAVQYQGKTTTQPNPLPVVMSWVRTATAGA